MARLARFLGEIWGVLSVFFLLSCIGCENRENKYLPEFRVSSRTRAHSLQTYTFCFHNLHSLALSFYKNDWQTTLFRPPIWHLSLPLADGLWSFLKNIVPNTLALRCISTDYVRFCEGCESKKCKNAGCARSRARAREVQKTKIWRTQNGSRKCDSFFSKHPIKTSDVFQKTLDIFPKTWEFFSVPSEKRFLTANRNTKKAGNKGPTSLEVQLLMARIDNFQA